MNTYNNAKGVNKDEARFAMVDSIAKSNTSKGEILTLPNIRCKIEQMVLTEVSKKYTFIGVERDPKTYKKMCAYIQKNNLTLDIIPFLGSFSKLIMDKKRNAYSHVIADYCGQLYPQSKELKYALEKKIVEKDGTISITLNSRISTGRDKTKAALKYEKEMVKGFGKREKQYNRCEWQLKCFIERYGKNNFEIETMLPYTDPKNGKRGANMILCIVRRIK